MNNKYIGHKKDGQNTSWQGVAGWYKDVVGERGSYYHQHVVLPGVQRLLSVQPFTSVLDLGCGQGVFGRFIGAKVDYLGVDLATSLINFAQKNDPAKNHSYKVADIAKELSLEKKDFDVAVCLLALQNTDKPQIVLENAIKHLKENGRLLLVINHPCFRIPRQSAWGVDEKQNVQYRRVSSYMSPMKIPVAAHPSQGEKSPVTWSMHFSITDLSGYLAEAGFLIEKIEEWVSDKKSEGGAASRENKSRKEIPLFMGILARKLDFKGYP
jgi:SAM-dependent methyltransferase